LNIVLEVLKTALVLFRELFKVLLSPSNEVLEPLNLSIDVVFGFFGVLIFHTIIMAEKEGNGNYNLYRNSFSFPIAGSSRSPYNGWTIKEGSLSRDQV
jgi:hypothetical protein